MNLLSHDVQRLLDGGFTAVLNGMPVYTTTLLTQQVALPTDVRRSWRERLFTRPWRPRVRSKIVMVMTTVPDDTIYQRGNIYLMHPTTLQKLTAVLATTGAPLP